MARLCPLLVDSYRRYKRETSAFLDWLCNTARSTATVDDIFINGSTANTNGRKKAKAQKRACKYTISVNSFIRLAQAIATSTSFVVPRSILFTLEDVINARKGCASWYKANQTGKSGLDQAHNEGHQHFIRILEEVHKVLEPRKARNDNRNHVNPDVHDSSFTNMFEHLELEECNEADIDTQPAPKRPTNIKQTQKDTYELEISPEEVSFAVYCLLKDFTRIRILVRQTWRDYKLGHATLTTAATVMNTAVSVFRRLEEAFRETYAQIQDHIDLTSIMFQGDEGEGSQSSRYLNVDLHTPQDMDGIQISLLAFVCSHTYRMLKLYFVDMHCCMYNGGLNRVLTEDEVSLLRCLTTFDLVAQITGHQTREERSQTLLFPNDELFATFLTVKETRTLSTSAVFAFQLFMDTRCELQGEISRTFEEFRQGTAWVIGTLEAGIAFAKTDKTSSWYHQQEGSATQFLKALRTMRYEDVVQNMFDVLADGDEEISRRYDWGDHYFLRNHPMGCGILLHSYLSSLHHASMTQAGGEGPPHCVMHLYHASRLVGILPDSEKWEDLDYLIDAHGENYIFVGGRPTEIQQLHPTLYRSLGWPAKYLSSESRSMKHELKHPSLKRNLFVKRYLGTIARYTQHTVQKDGEKFRPSRASEDPSVMLEQLVNWYLDESNKQQPANPLNGKPKGSRTRHLTPMQSMTLFKEVLEADDFPLRFNLFEMNKRCIQLLRCIQRVCLLKSPEAFPSDRYTGDERLIGLVVAGLFGGLSGHFTRQVEVMSRLTDACKLLRNLVAKQGDVEHLKAVACIGIVSDTALSDVDDVGGFENPATFDINDRLRNGFRLIREELEKGSEP